jgi:hypothetical protein
VNHDDDSTARPPDEYRAGRSASQGCCVRPLDPNYRLLLSAPPDDISTPDGPVRVVERHSCAYGAHRFGHVILQYRDSRRVASRDSEREGQPPLSLRRRFRMSSGIPWTDYPWCR